MEYKEMLGKSKKSFELNYDGGTIWCEHLDSMGNLESDVIRKFEEDYKTFIRPSVSSFMIINLDETIITGEITDCIVKAISESPKRFMKIAFVGVAGKYRKSFRRIYKDAGIVVGFLDDLEKAKEWTLKY
ncbi:MAG: hypothetical protein ACI4EU_02625 [Butyrivibrio sp.]